MSLWTNVVHWYLWHATLCPLVSPSHMLRLLGSGQWRAFRHRPCSDSLRSCLWVCMHAACLHAQEHPELGFGTLHWARSHAPRVLWNQEWVLDSDESERGSDGNEGFSHVHTRRGRRQQILRTHMFQIRPRPSRRQRGIGGGRGAYPVPSPPSRRAGRRAPIPSCPTGLHVP